jgi:hypothetical protein
MSILGMTFISGTCSDSLPFCTEHWASWDTGCCIAWEPLLFDCSHLCHSWQQCSKNLCIITSMLWFQWCLLPCLLPACRWNPCPLQGVVPRWFCMVWPPHRPHRRTQLCRKPLPASYATGNSQPVTVVICCTVVGAVSLSDSQLPAMSWLIISYLNCLCLLYAREPFQGNSLLWSVLVWMLRFWFSGLWRNVAEAGGSGFFETLVPVSQV